MSEETITSLVRQLERLRVEEAHIIQRIRAIADAEVAAGSVSPHHQHRLTPQVGDTIHINNRRTLLPTDLTATVTKVAPGKVYFTTRGGTKSWRAPKNVTIILQNGEHGFEPPHE